MTRTLLSLYPPRNSSIELSVTWYTVYAININIKSRINAYLDKNSYGGKLTAVAM